MMQDIRLFNVCEARRASRRDLKGNVLHHPVQAKNLTFQSLYLQFILSIKYTKRSYTQPRLLPF